MNAVARMLSLVVIVLSATVCSASAAEPRIGASPVLDDRYPERRVVFSGDVIGLPDLTYSALAGYRPLILDLYKPAKVAQPLPLIIYIHGGGWIGGHTRHSAAFEDWPGTLAALASRGYVVASVEYRLSSEAPFPAAVQDVKAAIRWLRAHATEFGIDKSRAVVWGGSAGGQLAALVGASCGVAALEPPGTAANQRPEPGAAAARPVAETTSAVSAESDCVQGVIAWYGVFDFSHVLRDAEGQPRTPEYRYLGCAPGSCAAATVAMAGAVTHVDSKDPPVLMIHGVNDRTVPIEQSRSYLAALRSKGVKAELLEIPDVDHSFIGKTPAVTREASLKALDRSIEFIDTISGSANARATEHSIPADPIRIDSGLIAGKQLSSGVRGYFGVPFAAPPVLDLRWREPQPVEPWQGVYHADRFAPQCMQILRPSNINHYFGHEPTSEDCLYLNLWAPGQRGGEKLPVIVWIHGGGFSIGSPSMANYGGENLARKGVIYVAMGYRLGGFGFMAHPELTAESSHRASGNYGFLDQVAALRWIQRNIEKFGGDPQRVIIAGQSAGASSAFALQTSALAKGLFHGVVGMSGGGIRANAQPPSLARAEQAGLEMQKVMRASSLADLRALPADRLLAAQAEFQLGGTAGTVRFGPAIDGYFWSEPPAGVFASGRQSDVPLLVGFTRDESSNELRAANSVSEFQTAARKYFGDRADEFLRLYPAREENVAQVGAQAVRDGGMATSVRSWAVAQRERGKSPAYVYMFSHAHPYPPGVRFADLNPQTAGAYHTSEVPYFLLTQDVYNRIRETRAWTQADRQLAEDLSDLLVAFARTGKPRTAAIKLEPFDQREAVTVLDSPVTTIRFDAKRMQFFSTVDMPGVVGPAPGGARARD